MPRKGENIYKRKDGRWEALMYIIMRIISQNIDTYTEKHILKSKQNEWKIFQNIRMLLLPRRKVRLVWTNCVPYGYRIKGRR